MRASIKELLDDYQVRRSFKQKQTFIKWMRNHAQNHDYQLYEHEYKRRFGKGSNLVVGDIVSAELIITAHYDTPPNVLIPIVSIAGNMLMYLFGQLAMLIQAFIVFWLISTVITNLVTEIGFLSRQVPFLWFEVSVLMLIFLILWVIQMTMGFANRKNANDNTSGVAVLIALLEDLPSELRSKVCFVFFDEEEKGLEGSKAFKKTYFEKIKNKPLINFDCVAHGKHLLFVTSNCFTESTYHPLLQDAVAGEALVKPTRGYLNLSSFLHPSDQFVFENTVAVAAFHRLPLIGYFLNRIHSIFDTKFDVKNIEKLNQIMIRLIKKI